MSNPFRKKHDRDPFGKDNPDPMSGTANLADAMLVLAVGIMLALVINWHVNINGSSTTKIDQSQMKEVTSDEYKTKTENDIDDKSDRNSLQKRGTVYVDTDTGKMYLVVKGEQ